MKFVADEGVGGPIVERLRQAGHEVRWILETNPTADDEVVLRISIEENCVLITQDKDFGEIVFRNRSAHTGIILMRLEGLSNRLRAESVLEVIEKYGEKLRGAFTVLTPDVIRIRPSSGTEGASS